MRIWRRSPVIAYSGKKSPEGVLGEAKVEAKRSVTRSQVVVSMVVVSVVVVSMVEVCMVALSLAKCAGL